MEKKTINRAPSEGLLSKGMIELSVLKWRVDIVMRELSELSMSHRDLQRQLSRSWLDKLLGR